MSDMKMYDILGNFKGLNLKDAPTDTASDVVYEDVKLNDVTSVVDTLLEKYQGFKEAKDEKSSEEKEREQFQKWNEYTGKKADSELPAGNSLTPDPTVNRFLMKARAEKPNARNDLEAMTYQMAKNDEELAKTKQELEAALQQQQQIDAEQNEKLSAVTGTPVAPEQPAPTPVAAEPTAPTAVPKAVRTRAPSSINIPTATQAPAEVPAQAANDTQVVKRPRVSQGQRYTPTIQGKKEKPQLSVVRPELTKPVDLTAVTGIPSPEEVPSTANDDLANVFAFPSPGKKTGTYNESKIMSEENPEQLQFDFNKQPELRNKLIQDIQGFIRDTKQTRLQLQYPNGRNIVIPRQYIERIAEILRGTDPNSKREFLDKILPDPDKFREYIQQVKVQGNTYYFYKVPPKYEIQARNMGLGQTKNGSWYSPNFPNPQAEKLYGPGRKWTAPSKQQAAPAQQTDTFEDKKMQENNLKSSILEGVRQVEEGKKLKDKAQFDATANTGDYYVTSKGNKVIKTDTGVKHEKTYAGDDDKDDLDESSYSAKAARAGKDIGKPGKAFAKIAKSAGERYGSKERGEKVAGAVLKKLRANEGEEVDESGLQAYLGKKKYGKEGMKALQKAGREGASKEKMALIRAKHDKMDEAAKPDYIDLDKDGNKTEPMKQAAKDAKKVDEVAPPGAKAERMVKHIKKGYAKDGKLTPKEKGIAYATAWKAHNKGQVEEATEFGDTIKNSEAKMTKVTVKEGKEAIRNHPIYTDKNAWDHYKKELDEQEAMDEAVLAPDVVNVQQELDEIARLAGLPPKMETTCESCGCAESACKCSTLEEAATRKDFRQVAELIRNIEDKAKRLELATHHAEIFKKQNPRFKHDVFCKACGVDECGMTAPATIIVGEEDKCPACDCAPCKCDESMMDEGNEFTKARLDAIAAGKDTFTVSGKTYNVSGDTSQEKQQVESVDDEKQAVTEDINVSITANGEEDALNLLRKLSGLATAETPQVTGVAIPVEEEYCDACDSTDCHCDESVAEERDIEYANTPAEQTAPISAAIPSGSDLHKSKRQDPHTANKAANPLELDEAVQEDLWKAYESMINDLKA